MEYAIGGLVIAAFGLLVSAFQMRRELRRAREKHGMAP
jgi:uncharacterized integral membrane protein